MGAPGARDRDDGELDGDPKAKQRSRHQPPQEARSVSGRGEKGGERDACDARVLRAVLGWAGLQWGTEVRLALPR